MEDTTSQVVWMQPQSWHADIRVPASRPSFAGKTRLDQLNGTELLELAKQQGFAGVTEVKGEVCRWLRRHDFQPPSGANDIGRMEFETLDRVLEYGVEADYFEISFGKRESANSTGRIELSTLPWKQGTTISIHGL